MMSAKVFYFYNKLSVPEVRVHLLERGHTGDGRLALLLPLGLSVHVAF